MGDDLAQELYRVFCNESDLVAGSGDVPNWASMPSSQREVWEQVAAKARSEMLDRVFGALDSIQGDPKYDVYQESTELRRRFGR